MGLFSRFFLADTSEGRTELERALLMMGSIHIGKQERELKSVIPDINLKQSSEITGFLKTVHDCLPMKEHLVPGNADAVIYQTATYVWYLLTTHGFNGGKVNTKNLEQIISEKAFPNKCRAAYAFGLRSLNYISTKGRFDQYSHPLYNKLIFLPKHGYLPNYMDYINCNSFEDASLLFKKAIYVALTTGMVCPLLEKWSDPDMIDEKFGNIILSEHESAKLFGVRYQVTMMELTKLDDDELEIMNQMQTYMRIFLRNY